MSLEEMNRPTPPPQDAEPADEAHVAPPAGTGESAKTGDSSFLLPRNEGESDAEYAARVRKAADEKFRAENPWLYENQNKPPAPSPPEKESDFYKRLGIALMILTGITFASVFILPAYAATAAAVVTLCLMLGSAGSGAMFLGTKIAEEIHEAEAKEKASSSHDMNCDDRRNALMTRLDRLEKKLKEAPGAAPVGDIQAAVHRALHPEEKDSPLFEAVKDNNPARISTLLDLYPAKDRPSPDDTDADGDTPLHLAVRKGYRSCVGMLLNYGADIDTPNDAGETPRSIALRDGDPEILETIAHYQYQSLKNPGSFPRPRKGRGPAPHP